MSTKTLKELHDGDGRTARARILLWSMIAVVAAGAFWGRSAAGKEGAFKHLAGDHWTEGVVEGGWITCYASVGGGSSIPADAIFSLDGRLVFVTGISGHARGKTEIVTIAYDVESGEKEWVRSHRRLRDDSSMVAQIVICPRGDRLYLAGWRHGRGKTSTLTLAYDTRTGKLLWESDYLASKSLGSQGRDLAVSPDGSLLFVRSKLGTQNSASGDAVVAYEARTGKLVWESVMDGREQGLTHMVVCADGRRLYVSGVQWQRDSVVEWRVSALDPANGVLLWSIVEPVLDSAELSGVMLSDGGDKMFLYGTCPSRGGVSAVAIDVLAGKMSWHRSYFADRRLSELFCHLVEADGDQQIMLMAKEAVPGKGKALMASALQVGTGDDLWTSEKPWAFFSHLPASHSMARAGALLVTAENSGAPHVPLTVSALDFSTGRPLGMAYSHLRHDVGFYPRLMAVSPDAQSIVVCGMMKFSAAGNPAYGTVLYRLKGVAPSGETSSLDAMRPGIQEGVLSSW